MARRSTEIPTFPHIRCSRSPFSPCSLYNRCSPYSRYLVQVPWRACATADTAGPQTTARASSVNPADRISSKQKGRFHHIKAPFVFLFVLLSERFVDRDLNFRAYDVYSNVICEVGNDGLFKIVQCVFCFRLGIVFDGSDISAHCP